MIIQIITNDINQLLTKIIKMKKSSLFVAAALSIISCKQTVNSELTKSLSGVPQQFNVSNIPYNGTNPLLKNANTDFEIGAAINEGKFNNSFYKDLAGNQYNSITAENEMKFKNIQLTQGNYTFGHQIVDFAKEHGINRVHGHTIMWYRDVPSWVINAGGNTTGETRKQIYRSILYNHIYNTFNYYYQNYKDSNLQPLVKSWDVVNEAFNNADGGYRSNATNVWAKELGAYDAVRLAFLYARQIAENLGDTNLKLFYNDYGQEYSDSKTDAIYNLVNNLKEIKYNNKPIIDGVGLQLHTTSTRTVNGPSQSVSYALTKMAATGLLVHISELDIILANGQVGDQNYRWYNIPKSYRTLVPSAQRWGITLWNIGDSDSWRLPAEAATLYEANTYNKKSAYVNFYKGLNE